MGSKLAAAEQPLVFVSSFSTGEKAGIYAFRMNLDKGTLERPEHVANIEHPFFMALSKDRKRLYSISTKTFGGPNEENVAAFEVNHDSGRLKALGETSSRGTASCYIDVDSTGRTVLVANYSSGSVASLPVGKDGRLGSAVSLIAQSGSSVHPQRQKEPHAHAIVISPDEKYAFLPDLGLDQILCFKLDAAASTLTPHAAPFTRTPPGAGPRHLIFDPAGKHVYVINELHNSITLFDYDAAAGRLSEQQTLSTLPADFNGESHCADLKITPNGKFLYGTNRGHDSVAAFRLDDNGRMTTIEIVPSLGKGPQNLAITRDGKWLLCANMAGDTLSVFRIDQETGGLTSAGKPLALKAPSCIRIVEFGK